MSTICWICIPFSTGTPLIRNNFFYKNVCCKIFVEDFKINKIYFFTAHQNLLLRRSPGSYRFTFKGLICFFCNLIDNSRLKIPFKRSAGAGRRYTSAFILRL